MDRNFTSYPKVLRDKAKANGKSLICCGNDGPGGRNEMVGQADDRVASFLFLFALALYRTGDPFASFDEANSGLKVPFERTAVEA